MTYNRLLKKIQEYVSLSDVDSGVLASLFEERTLSKGELFLREGHVCRELAFINKGLVCYFVTQDGNEVVHNFAKEGNFICNYDSLISRIPSQKNILALESTELLVISREKLDRLYTAIPQGERFGRLLMQNVYTEAIRHIISFYTDTPQKRYQEFVARHQDLAQRIPQYYIASFIGVKPQSLSRIRKRMQVS